ncbi:MAG: lipoprotein [Bacteroidetes bacterium]|jgi:hypothetical protein|nr:lipoprotein [Bacteroidota bacterium]
MKIITFFLTFISGYSFNIYSQQILFKKTYPPPATVFCHRPNYGMTGRDIAFSSDNNIMILGSCLISGDSCPPSTVDNQAIRLLKLKPNGDTLLSKVMMNPYLDPNNATYFDAYSIKSTSDNQFIVAGNTQPGTYSLIDAFLMKTDSAGNKIWKKEYYNKLLNYFSVVIETDDHGYLAGGYTSDAQGQNQDIYIVKTDSIGNEQWHKTYHDGYWGFCNSLIDNHNGTYTVIGGIMPNSAAYNSYNFLLMNIDSATGNEISHNFYSDTTKNQNCKKGISTLDHKYILVGDASGYRGNALMTVKVDTLGNKEWENNYGGDSLKNYIAYDIVETCDSGYIIVGGVDFYDSVLNMFHSAYNYFLLKIDKFGNKEWEKINNDTIPNTLISIKLYSDNSYITTGVFGSSALAIRFDSLFICNPTVIHENNSISTSNSISIAPNPFTSETLITFSEVQKNSIVRIIDVLGKEIKTDNFSGNQLIIEKGEMKKGIYFVQIIDAKKNVVNRKIILQ